MDLKIAAQQLITAANGRLRATQLSILVTEVLRQYDAQDGVEDNIISQSDQYRFDMSKIICSCPSRCPTRTQADTAGKILGDYIVKAMVEPDGLQRLHPQLTLKNIGLSTSTLTPPSSSTNSATSVISSTTSRPPKPPTPSENNGTQSCWTQNRRTRAKLPPTTSMPFPFTEITVGKITIYDGLADSLISPRRC